MKKVSSMITLSSKHSDGMSSTPASISRGTGGVMGLHSPTGDFDDIQFHSNKDQRARGLTISSALRKLRGRKTADANSLFSTAPPPPPKRAPATALSQRSKSMTAEMEELEKLDEILANADKPLGDAAAQADSRAATVKQRPTSRHFMHEELKSLFERQAIPVATPSVPGTPKKPPVPLPAGMYKPPDAQENGKYAEPPMKFAYSMQELNDYHENDVGGDVIDIADIPPPPSTAPPPLPPPDYGDTSDDEQPPPPPSYAPPAPPSPVLLSAGFGGAVLSSFKPNGESPSSGWHAPSSGTRGGPPPGTEPESPTDEERPDDAPPSRAPKKPLRRKGTLIKQDNVESSPEKAAAAAAAALAAACTIPSIIIKEPSTSSSGNASLTSSVEYEGMTTEVGGGDAGGKGSGNGGGTGGGDARGPFAAAIAGAVRDRERRLEEKRRSMATPTPAGPGAELGMAGAADEPAPSPLLTVPPPVGPTALSESPRADLAASGVHPLSGEPLQPTSPMALILAARQRAVNRQSRRPSERSVRGEVDGSGGAGASDTPHVANGEREPGDEASNLKPPSAIPPLPPNMLPPDAATSSAGGAAAGGPGHAIQKTQSVEGEEDFVFSDPLPPPLQFCNSFESSDEQMGDQVLEKIKLRSTKPNDPERRNTRTVKPAGSMSPYERILASMMQMPMRGTGSVAAPGAASHSDSVDASADSGLEEMDSRSSSETTSIVSTASNVSTVSSEGGEASDGNKEHHNHHQQQCTQITNKPARFTINNVSSPPYSGPLQRQNSKGPSTPSTPVSPGAPLQPPGANGATPKVSGFPRRSKLWGEQPAEAGRNGGAGGSLDTGNAKSNVMNELSSKLQQMSVPTRTGSLLGTRSSGPASRPAGPFGATFTVRPKTSQPIVKLPGATGTATDGPEAFSNIVRTPNFPVSNPPSQPDVAKPSTPPGSITNSNLSVTPGQNLGPSPPQMLALNTMAAPHPNPNHGHLVNSNQVPVPANPSLGSNLATSKAQGASAGSKPFSQKPIGLWSKYDVADWLDSLNLSEHKERFLDNEIEGTHLPNLEKEDFVELGVTRVGHRMNIERALRQLLGR